jgi:hypothetical protein
MGATVFIAVCAHFYWVCAVLLPANSGFYASGLQNQELNSF